MQFEVTFTGRVACHSDDAADAAEFDADLEAHFDAVMEELLQLNALDPSIGLTGADGSVEISVLVEESDLDKAGLKGSSLIRAAVHAAGGHTPGWSINWVEARTIDRTNMVPA